VNYVVLRETHPCLVPVSVKPLLQKTTMWSDWTAGLVCCDWSTALRMFGKSHTP